MEQLVIFVLFIVASIVSSIIQKKKKAEEEAQHRTGLPPTSSGKPPVFSWPQSAHDWQEQLRKMLEEKAPPPVIRPVIVPQKQEPSPVPRTIIPPIVPVYEPTEGDVEFRSPLRESASAYQRASNLQAKVEERLRAVDERTTAHRPLAAISTRKRELHPVVRTLRKNPAAVRNAFIASLIFSAPKSLEAPGREY